MTTNNNKKKKPPGFLLYGDDERMFGIMDSDEKTRILDAMFAYFNKGTLPNFPNNSRLEVFWVKFKTQIDNDIDRYEKKCKQSSDAILSRWEKQRQNE